MIGLRLAAYGPSDDDEYLRQKTKKKIIDLVRNIFTEEEAREASEHDVEEVEEIEDYFEQS